MRFSIRDLLWLTLVVAMGLGWWADNETKQAAVEQARRLHSSLGIAKEWHDAAWGRYLGGVGAYVTVSDVPNTPPNWAPLDEPLIEP
jgi:hypothetical protein